MLTFSPVLLLLLITESNLPEQHECHVMSIELLIKSSDITHGTQFLVGFFFTRKDFLMHGVLNLADCWVPTVSL